MHLEINGYLLDSTEDDSLKFEKAVDESLTDEIVRCLGHRSLNAMAECEWRLTDEQVSQLSVIMGQSLPINLKLLIGVVA